ncbi:MAG TPA: efflux RND transporter permease subunit [Gemmatimonadales bacterium]|nr:efflux RND transporter permease subunit [Gemmatimonadales bacterium]
MIRWAAHRPAVIWAICFSLLLAGGVAFTRLPLATRTTVELPRLQIFSSWPGVSAELMETYVTSPIEAAIQPVRGVKKTSSESTEGSASITVELEPGTDVQMARLAIHERLEAVRNDFPPGVSPPEVSNYVPDDLQEQPLLRYTMEGPYTPGALLKIAEDIAEPRLKAVEGVSGVNSYGGATPGVTVAYDGSRLRQLGISPVAIRTAVQNARVVEALGEQQEGATESAVVVRDEPENLRDLEALPITGPGGQVFRLGELATVRPSEDNRGRFYRLNGETAVALSISRLPGADAIKTAERVKAEADNISRLLPPGVVLKLQNDESIELGKQLNDLVLRGAIAFLAVMLVLAISLRNAKSVALVMGSAAVAIAGTSLGLYLLHIPANLLTLAGLGMGVGILVQNGLVVVERLRTSEDTPEGRAEAGRRITPAVVGATLTTAVVLFPFLYLQGNARAAFIPFAAAFALALAWSVISALVMIPALGSGHGMHRAGWPRLRHIYGKAVGGLVRWRWVTMALATAAVGLLAWAFVKKVPKSNWSFGGFQRTTLTAGLSFPKGSDPASLDRGMREFEAIVVGVPGVEEVETRGSPDGANMTVVFEKEAGYGPLPYELYEKLTQRALLIGGAVVSVQPPQGPGYYGGSSGGGVSSYRIKLLGYSFDGVEQLAMDLKRRLERIPRVRNVDINAASFWRTERTVSVVLDPDRDALARYGVTAGDFAGSVARELAGGPTAMKLQIGEEELPVSVQRAGADSRSLEDLRQAIVPSPSDAPVRIRDLARVDEQTGLGTVSREDQQYLRIVGYEFRGPPKLAERTHKAFMASISVPPGYSVGDEEFSWAPDDSAKGLWLVFGIGVVLVILSVALVFDSVWAAMMIFLSLPLALGGVVAAFWITGNAFTREAAVGVILVVGLAVNQAILLVDAALEMRRQDGRDGRDGQDGRVRRKGLGVAQVVDASVDRSGMIVMVTLTTLASLLPLAIGTDPDSLFGAIALATAGGTVAGTIGAMFVVPAMVGGGRMGRMGWMGRMGRFVRPRHSRASGNP